MTLRGKKTKSFEEYKEKTVPVYRDKKGSIQRTVPIHRIARDGIFQIEDAPEGEDKTFDKNDPGYRYGMDGWAPYGKF